MSSSTAAPVPDTSLDVPGPSILCLEHFNFDVPSSDLARLFYSSILSFTCDPQSTAFKATTTWMNLGRHQIHLPHKPDPNRLDGRLGLVIDTQHWSEMQRRLDELKALDAVKGSLLGAEKVREKKDGSYTLLHVCALWGVREEQDGTVEYWRVTCPWGNTFDVYAAPLAPALAGDSAEGRGIAYGVIHVPHTGSLPGIAQYYSRYFQTHTTLTPALATITVGPSQRLFYSYSTSPDLSATPPSWHYCIYLSAYGDAFRRLLADGLVAAIEDRGDYVTDWHGAREKRQFRALSMGWEAAWGVEQELRSAKHKHYNRQLLNERQHMPSALQRQLTAEHHP